MIRLLGDCLFSAEHLGELKPFDAVVCLGSRCDPSDVRYADVY